MEILMDFHLHFQKDSLTGFQTQKVIMKSSRSDFQKRSGLAKHSLTAIQKETLTQRGIVKGFRLAILMRSGLTMVIQTVILTDSRSGSLMVIRLLTEILTGFQTDSPMLTGIVMATPKVIHYGSVCPSLLVSILQANRHPHLER